MTKQEYLEKLQAALEAKVPELQQEVMEDYEVHFEMGIKNGKTEEQLCEELGDIDEFVTELAQMESDHQVHAGSPSGQPAEAVGADESVTEPGDSQNTENIGNAENAGSADTIQNDSVQDDTADTTSADPEEEDVEHCHGKVEGKGADMGIDWDGIQNTVNKALNSVQEFINQKNVQDLIYKGEEALYQGSTIIHEKVQEYFKGPAFEGEKESSGETDEDVMVQEDETHISEMKNLVLEGLGADVLVEPSEDGRFHINYRNFGSVKQQMQYRFYFREEGDTIYAGVRKSKTAAGMFWGSFSPTMELTVKLPTMAERVEITTASGDISMKGLQAKEFRVSSASGDHKLYQIQADAMRVSTASGDVQADNMNVKFLEIQSKSGDVQADDMHGEAILVKSMSGDVKVSHVDCKELSISSTSGDATGRNIQAEQMACTSTSGDSKIQGDFGRCRVESVSGDATLTTGKDLDASISSVSGDARVNLSNNGRGFELNYQTVSGELEIRYGGEHQYLTRNGKVEKGEKGSRIYLKTVSGDMMISD